MVFQETKLKGAFIIELEKLGDDRGFFARTFCRREFEEHGLNPFVAQANTSYSALRGTLRGMHFQRPPHDEAKLVRCTSGSLFDVIVDLRPSSQTYLEWIGAELTAQNHRMLYVPEGFAHGFMTLEDHTEVSYLVSDFYAPHSEGGYRYDDPAFGIEWPGEPTILSPKDQNWPDFG